MTDARTRPYNIPVGAFYGWIHLGGKVPTQAAQSAAEEVAASIPTVRGVVTLPHLPSNNKPTCLETGKGNCQIQPQIGSQAYARDGLAGIVAGVIINPRNRLVDYMILAADYETNGQTVRRELLYPTEAVNHTNDGSIFLADSLHKLAKRPIFQEADFPTAPLEWQPPYPYLQDLVRWNDRLAPRTNPQASNREET